MTKRKPVPKKAPKQVVSHKKKPLDPQLQKTYDMLKQAIQNSHNFKKDELQLVTKFISRRKKA